MIDIQSRISPINGYKSIYTIQYTIYNIIVTTPGYKTTTRTFERYSLFHYLKVILVTYGVFIVDTFQTINNDSCSKACVQACRWLVGNR